MNDEIRRALRPVKNRIRRNRFLRGAATGLAAGLLAVLLLQAVSFLLPVPDKGIWAAVAVAAGVLSGALGNMLRPVKDRTAAETADACGLEERAVTALEPGEEPIRQLQRRDACGALGRLDVKQIRPGSVRKALFTALGCAVLAGALLLVPNPQDMVAETRKVLDRTLKEGRETIARAAEEDEETLDEGEKNELRKITADLDRELGESRDAADAMMALDRAEQRLEEMRRQTAGEAAAAAAADGRTGESGDGKDGGDGNAAENAREGTAAQAGQGQQNAEVSPGGMADTRMNTLQALSALKYAVNPSATQAQKYAAAGGLQGMQGTKAGTNGNGPGNGGPGSGTKTGNGAGEGSTNEEQSGSGSHGSGTAPGNRPPKYKEAEYETIYDPERIDKATQDVATDEKRLTDEGSVQAETGPGRGNLSGDVPWSEALQEYADTEARTAERENLTTKERRWVDEYYRILTEQK